MTVRRWTPSRDLQACSSDRTARHCDELVFNDPEAAVAVNLDPPTDRIIELYWLQMRPLDGTLLKQSSDGRGVIFTAVADLRQPVAAQRLPPLATVITTSPDLFGVLASS